MFREKEETYADMQVFGMTNRETDSINVGASRKIAAPVTTLLVSGSVVTDLSLIHI